MTIPNPSIQHWFGNPVVDWSLPRHDPWPMRTIFEYIPTDEDGNAVEPGTEIYDTYDKAVAAWLNSWLFLKTRSSPSTMVSTGRPLPIVFATPDRALGQIVEKLCKGKNVSFDTPGGLKNVPMPFGSLEQSGDPEVDMVRWSNRRIRYGGLSYDDTEMLQYRHPVPLNFVYQLSIWSRLKLELDSYTVDFVRQFRGIEVFIKVTHGSGFGIRCVPLKLDAIQHANELEPGQENRLLRRVFQITLAGWVPHEPYSVKTVLRFDVDYTVTDDLASGTGVSDGTRIINDVRGEVVPGGGPDATRPLDGPFPEDS